MKYKPVTSPPSASAWSDEPPTVEGWYWWRASDEHRPSIKLAWDGGGGLIVKWGGETEYVHKIGGQWQPVVVRLE